MTFYGTGIVWDKVSNKALCRFENGKFETEDAALAEKLTELGYSSEKTAEPEAERPTSKTKGGRKK